MRYAIKLLDGPGTGMYVKHYDPKAHRGQGEVVGTENLADALKFNTIWEATGFWKQEYGIRRDGKPNRPLTASSVEIVKV